MTKQNLNIAVFAGDGIGPEIILEALKVLKLVADRRGLFVQPALFEAFGLTVVEAMVSGMNRLLEERG